MNKAQVMGIVRHLVSALGVYLVAQNPDMAAVYSPDSLMAAAETVIGAAMAVAGVIGSFMAKEKRG